MQARFPLIASTPVFAALFLLNGTLRAEPGEVSIRVEQENKSDMTTKNMHVRNHTRTLNIFLTNGSVDQLELKVKYVVFGRDMIHHDLITAGDGEMMATLKSHASERVVAPAVKTTATESYFDTKLKKKVDPSGSTIIGAGVQVMQGDKLVAEWYDPMSVKESWGKTIKK